MEDEHNLGADLPGEEKALIHMQGWARDKSFRDGKAVAMIKLEN